MCGVDEANLMENGLEVRHSITLPRKASYTVRNLRKDEAAAAGSGRDKPSGFGVAIRKLNLSKAAAIKRGQCIYCVLVGIIMKLAQEVIAGGFVGGWCTSGRPGGGSGCGAGPFCQENGGGWDLGHAAPPTKIRWPRGHGPDEHGCEGAARFGAVLVEGQRARARGWQF